MVKPGLSANPAAGAPCIRWIRVNVNGGVKPFKFKSAEKDGDDHRWALVWWHEGLTALGSKKPLHQQIQRNGAAWKDWFSLLWPGADHPAVERDLPGLAGASVTTKQLIAILCWGAGAAKRSLHDRASGATLLAAFLEPFLDKEPEMTVALHRLSDGEAVKLQVQRGWVVTDPWAQPASNEFVAQFAQDFQKSGDHGGHPWAQGNLARCKLSHLLCVLLVDPQGSKGHHAKVRHAVAYHLVCQLAMLVELRAILRAVAIVPRDELRRLTDKGHLKRNNTDLKAAIHADKDAKKAPSDILQLSQR